MTPASVVARGLSPRSRRPLRIGILLLAAALVAGGLSIQFNVANVGELTWGLPTILGLVLFGVAIALGAASDEAAPPPVHAEEFPVPLESMVEIECASCRGTFETPEETLRSGTSCLLCGASGRLREARDAEFMVVQRWVEVRCASCLQMARLTDEGSATTPGTCPHCSALIHVEPRHSGAEL